MRDGFEPRHLSAFFERQVELSSWITTCPKALPWTLATFPSTPSRSSRRASRKVPMKRLWNPTWFTRRFAWARSESSLLSFAESVSGFSTKRWRFLSSARFAHG